MTTPEIFIERFTGSLVKSVEIMEGRPGFKLTCEDKMGIEFTAIIEGEAKVSMSGNITTVTSFVTARFVE